MAQIFRPRADAVARAALVGLAVAPVLLFGLGYAIMRSPYVTEQNVTREQPVPFSHEHHVGQLGIACRYCHTSVETARFAGIPPTETCMTCHSQIWTNAGMLAPVRTGLAQNRPCAGGASTTCRTTSISTTAFTSRTASAARPVTAAWT